jgi:hypothetical protein
VSVPPNGTTLRELMDRMGHDSQRAAMVYLNGSEERQHEIADTLSKLATEEMKRGSKRQGGESTTRRSGMPRARNRKQASGGSPAGDPEWGLTCTES